MRPHSVRSSLLAASLVLGLAVGTAADVTAGPISRLYVTQFNAVEVIQEGVLVDSWATVTDNERPLAVGTTVRTLSQFNGTDGYEYTLDGTPTGTSYDNTGPCCFRDGTTDGVHNYAMADTAFGTFLYQFNADWSNPQPLPISGFGEWATGVAYDARDDSFWVSDSVGAGGHVWIYHVTRTGGLLGAFSTARGGFGTALALDPADYTLWLWSSRAFGSNADDRQFHQYSTAGGIELNRAALSSFLWGGASGAEFGPAAVAVPEPSTLMLLGAGLSSRRAWRRISRHRQAS